MKNKVVAEPRLLERSQEEPVAALEPRKITPPLIDVAAIAKETSLSEAAIRELAFHLYEERGFRNGHDVEDWLEAEAILLSQAQQVA
jgi:hypothetical protein